MKKLDIGHSAILIFYNLNTRFRAIEILRFRDYLRGRK